MHHSTWPCLVIVGVMSNLHGDMQAVIVIFIRIEGGDILYYVVPPQRLGRTETDFSPPSTKGQQ